MIFYYINGVNRSEDVEADTLSAAFPLQQRSNKASFNMFRGVKPMENQDVKIFTGAIVESHDSDKTIVLKDSYNLNFEFFRPGQKLRAIREDNIEVFFEVDTYDEATRTIVATETLDASLSENEIVLGLFFGGVVARVSDSNLHSLDNIEYSITCVGYLKIFDKKIMADVWQNVDARYLINDIVNQVVNYNQIVHNLDYGNNTAIQAALTESHDALNPVVNTSDFMEGTSSAKLEWVSSFGAATWTGAITSDDYTEFTGVATSTSSSFPTSGLLMAWVKLSVADFSQINPNFSVKIGSSASDYLQADFKLVDSSEWQYLSVKLSDTFRCSVNGTVDWSAIDYIQITVNEGIDGYILMNGLRVNQDNSFTCYNIANTPDVGEYRAANIRPSVIINNLAKAFSYAFFIDNDRDIHFIEKDVAQCYYEITDTSFNFYNLGTEVDASQLGNRVIVRGQEEASSFYYPQVIEGDGVRREWLMKSKFSDLSLLIDDNTSTDTMEAMTTTTTVKATAHGLSVGDHVVMRSRNNVVREVLTVPDADTFTVLAVTSQASGDTFSKFATSATVGVEGLTDESTVDYVANSNEKSVRATANTSTLNSGTFIRFKYLERLPIQIQYADYASINALKQAGIGDGIFDLDPITDSNIQDRNTAILVAQAKVNEFSEAVILGGFETNFNGFKAGDIVHVELTDRGIDSLFLIQRVTAKQRGGKFFDHFNYSIEFGTTVFGIIEFYQKLLRERGSFVDNTDDIGVNFVDGPETIGVADTNRTTPENLKSESEEISLADTNTTNLNGNKWKWETSVGQPVKTRWNLFQWG